VSQSEIPGPRWPLKLHRGLGFEQVARFREVGRKFNRWFDLVFMQHFQFGAPVALRVHFRYSSNNCLRISGESVGDPAGLLARKYSSKTLCTEAVRSRKVLSSHSFAAGKRGHRR
jgi:hypothetical protein